MCDARKFSDRVEWRYVWSLDFGVCGRWFGFGFGFRVIFFIPSTTRVLAKIPLSINHPFIFRCEKIKETA